MKYAAKLTPDRESGGYTVTLPDVPEAITQGDTREEALRHAAQALEAALSFYVERDAPLPQPKHTGRYRVGVRALTEAKLALYSAMRTQGVTRAELARALRWQKSQVTRLLDPNHASRMEQVEFALASLGKEIEIRIIDAA